MSTTWIDLLAVLVSAGLGAPVAWLFGRGGKP